MSFKSILNDILIMVQMKKRIPRQAEAHYGHFIIPTSHFIISASIFVNFQNGQNKR